MLQICDRYLSYNCDRYLSHNCDRYVMGPNSYMLQICDRYLSYNCDRYLSHNCDRYLSHNCDRYLSNICDRYVMGPNSYMLQICDRYLCTYILQIFYRTVTYLCHISVSLVMQVSAAFPGGRHPGNSRATPGLGTEFVLKSRPGDRGFRLHLYFGN